MIRVVDVSEFTTEIPESWWVSLREVHGVQGAIIQAWGGGYIPGRRNEHFHQQAHGARLAFDGRVGCYVWPPADWAGALAWIGDYAQHMRLYAHDIEASAPIRRAFVEGVAASGIPQWVYASPASWRQIMANTADFQDLPLMLARYPLDPERPGGNVIWWPGRYDPFGSYSVGAWTVAKGWQFQGTTTFGNESMDLNLFHESAFEEGDMADSEVRTRLVIANLASLFLAHALAGTPLPTEIKNQIAWLCRLPR